MAPARGITEWDTQSPVGRGEVILNEGANATQWGNVSLFDTWFSKAGLSTRKRTLTPRTNTDSEWTKDLTIKI